MAATPRFKIYNPQGEFVGGLKFLEDCAAVVALYGDGATVRDGHSVKHTLWNEGKEEVKAEDSYDQAAGIMRGRM